MFKNLTELITNNFFVAGVCFSFVGFLLCRFRPVLVFVILPAGVLMIYDRIMKMLFHPPDQEIDTVYVIKFLASILLPILAPLAGALITWTKKGG